MASVTARMHKSDGPPIEVGTMIRIGFSGNAAAAAVPIMNATQIAGAANVDIQQVILLGSLVDWT
jgi:hypothetical protein